MWPMRQLQHRAVSTRGIEYGGFNPQAVGLLNASVTSSSGRLTRRRHRRLHLRNYATALSGKDATGLAWLLLRPARLSQTPFLDLATSPADSGPLSLPSTFLRDPPGSVQRQRRHRQLLLCRSILDSRSTLAATTVSVGLRPHHRPAPRYSTVPVTLNYLFGLYNPGGP